MKLSGLLVLFIITLCLFYCKTEQIILHGDLDGQVTDASTTLPLQAATVKLAASKDSTSTGGDGTYLLKNLTPGDYVLQAIKSGYGTNSKNVRVESEKTYSIDLALTPFPQPSPSDTLLDFGFDSTTLHFTISNKGKGSFTYVLNPTQDENWITISPSSGNFTDQNKTDTITVSVNRTGLSGSTKYAKIKLTSVISQGQIPDIYIDVFLNDIYDNRDNKHKHYRVVQIGTQIWMAENLDVGTLIPGASDQKDNGEIEKYCYGNSETMCDIYGGLYQWPEMMQYPPYDRQYDTLNIGTIQGICPDGWHIPTSQEWSLLFNYVGGNQVAGGKLKERGIGHWHSPNQGATDDYSFTGLPGGYRNPDKNFYDAGDTAVFRSSNFGPPGLNQSWVYALNFNDTWVDNIQITYQVGMSVRCVKNPSKK